MAKKQIVNIKLADFPEEVNEQNGMSVKTYGETSYENQMAVLSQFLHNGSFEGNDIEAREPSVKSLPRHQTGIYVERQTLELFPSSIN